jgi:hypothetical protein
MSPIHAEPPVYFLNRSPFERRKGEYVRRKKKDFPRSWFNTRLDPGKINRPSLEALGDRFDLLFLYQPAELRPTAKEWSSLLLPLFLKAKPIFNCMIALL